MTDQNLEKGDPVYPQYQATHHAPIEGNASPVSFVKGELATIDGDGFLIKLTTTKIAGLYQVKNAITGGLSGDDTVEAALLESPSRILGSLPVDAKKGDILQINGSNGTGNLVVSAATVDLANLGVGKIFELYRNDALKATAADLGVITLGVY